MARTAEHTGGTVMPSLDGQLSGGREGSADFQVFLRNRGAITMGNKALLLLPQLFDRTHHYIIASLGGTFDYPFTRDALVSAHLTRKALDTFFGGYPLNRPDLIANESLETIPKVVDINAGNILQEVGNKIRRSNAFFSDHQKSNGAYPHEMQLYQKGHPFLKSKFYTWRRGDEFMLNSDSIDATPRALMEAVNTLVPEEVVEFYPKAEKAFNWIIRNMREHHGFLAYEGNIKGLMSQGWMDSQQGRPLDEHGDIIPGSVALLEVQAQVWSAMTRWAYLLEKTFPDIPENKKYRTKARQLRKEAEALKARFNSTELNGEVNPHTFRTADGYFAHALVYPPGQAVPIQDTRVSINAGIALEADHHGETIFANNEDVRNIVHHLLSDTMFHEEAGIFTFDRNSVHDGSEGDPINQHPDGYHFGKNVCWPFASVMAAEGILKAAYNMQWAGGIALGMKAMGASLMPILNTQTFLEQFTYVPENHSYVRFKHHTDNGEEKFSNVTQTWTVAGFLRAITYFGLLDHLDFSNYKEGEEIANRAPLR